MPNLTGIGGGLEGEVVAPPSTRKDAHLLGQVCLAEALSWARMALQSIEQSSDLNREATFKTFVGKDVDMCVDYHAHSRSNCTSYIQKLYGLWKFGILVVAKGGLDD